MKNGRAREGKERERTEGAGGRDRERREKRDILVGERGRESKMQRAGKEENNDKAVT